MYHIIDLVKSIVLIYDIKIALDGLLKIEEPRRYVEEVFKLVIPNHGLLYSILIEVHREVYIVNDWRGASLYKSIVLYKNLCIGLDGAHEGNMFYVD